MMVTWKNLNGTHRRTAQFTQGAEWRRRQLTAKEEKEVTVRYFSVYWCSLEMVISFKYLGLVILTTDDDWPAVVRKLARSKMAWSRMSLIISREGVMVKTVCSSCDSR